jgi:hypothetical protein
MTVRKRARSSNQALLHKNGTERTPAKAKFCRRCLEVLFGYHLSGLRTFLAHTFLKLDRLAFCKSLKTVPLNFREMNKQIFAALRFNEPKTLAFVKPFYCS